jgi:hypothetical protein
MGGSVTVLACRKLSSATCKFRLETCNGGDEIIAHPPPIQISSSINTQIFYNYEDIEMFLLLVYSRGNILDNIMTMLTYKHSRYYFLTYIEKREPALYEKFVKV